MNVTTFTASAYINTEVVIYEVLLSSDLQAIRVSCSDLLFGGTCRNAFTIVYCCSYRNSNAVIPRLQLYVQVVEQIHIQKGLCYMKVVIWKMPTFFAGIVKSVLKMK